MKIEKINGFLVVRFSAAADGHDSVTCIRLDEISSVMLKPKQVNHDPARNRLGTNAYAVEVGTKSANGGAVFTFSRELEAQELVGMALGIEKPQRGWKKQGDDGGKEGAA